MADIKTVSLPIPPPEYSEGEEAVTRRIIEQALDQFLLMGVKHG